MTPSQAILDCHKNISLHLSYLDKIWFANRLWSSKGSDINRFETGSSIQPSRSMRSKSMRKPNFVDISQLMAEILLLSFLKNKCPPYWKSTFRFDFDHLPEICTLFCIRLYRILSKSKHLLRKYDVISISQDGGRDGWILLPVSYLLMSLPSKGQSLLANQILSRYLKWRLRHLFHGNPKWLGKGSIFFKIKNVSISWNALLHFMNTKIYFWCL